jgi:hypothetical protein
MKVVVFCYTQSGQALDVARSICSGMKGFEVVLKMIVPQYQYPFPWSRKEFMEVFPETRLGVLPSGILPLDFSDVENADLVIVVGQSWFLSLSLPLQSFLAEISVRKYLKGRRVVFVNVCRNMWLMTCKSLKEYMKGIDAHLVGHIVMQDEHPNLVSALTIVRWLMYGRKESTGLLPAAGVSAQNIMEVSRFGTIIADAMKREGLGDLQNQLLASGAIKYRPSILFIEKIGHRMFGLWARFIRQKGGFGDSNRQIRLSAFYYYLLTVLFLVSPFGMLFFYLTYPFRHVNLHRQKDCSVN